MGTEGIVTLTRDCQATLIPSGETVTLKKGEEARITQALGGNYTLLLSGNLVRIEGKDADAIGKEPVTEAESPTEDDYSEPADEKEIWDAMKTCYDPEIPVNIVDLGLIYSCKITPMEEGGSHIGVKMTLTAPGCGLGPVLADEVTMKIRALRGVRDVGVDLVWDPPWSQEMMAEAAKLHLGMM